MSATEKQTEPTEETATNEIPQLGALEEDDEFEEFPVQGTLNSYYCWAWLDSCQQLSVVLTATFCYNSDLTREYRLG